MNNACDVPKPLLHPTPRSRYVCLGTNTHRDERLWAAVRRWRGAGKAIGAVSPQGHWSGWGWYSQARLRHCGAAWARGNGGAGGRVVVKRSTSNITHITAPLCILMHLHVYHCTSIYTTVPPYIPLHLHVYQCTFVYYYNNQVHYTFLRTISIVFNGTEM